MQKAINFKWKAVASMEMKVQLNFSSFWHPVDQEKEVSTICVMYSFVDSCTLRSKLNVAPCLRPTGPTSSQIFASIYKKAWNHSIPLEECLLCFLLIKLLIQTLFSKRILLINLMLLQLWVFMNKYINFFILMIYVRRKEEWLGNKRLNTCTYI